MPAPTDIATPLLEKMYRATTHPFRLLPDFIIIGTQRGGTTSLYNYLTEHPAVGTASIKEVHFFDSPHYNQGIAWYRAHFPSFTQKYYVKYKQKLPFITGEASPYYLYHPHVPMRIAQMFPGVKLIVMLRNPVDRAYSHYYHELAGGSESLSSFEEAIEREEERLAGESEKMLANENYYSFNHRHFSYLDRGKYVDQLRPWMSLFPKDQILIIKSEDFYADPAAILKQSLSFVGLRDTALPRQEDLFKRYNDTKPPRMNTTTRKRLLQYYEPHNERLYNSLGINFGWDK